MLGEGLLTEPDPLAWIGTCWGTNFVVLCACLYASYPSSWRLRVFLL